MASASVTSGASPLSGFEFDFPAHPDSTGDPDEAFWTAISNPSSGSLGPFLSSPASHSLGSSWAVVGNRHITELELSPAALPSPLNPDFDQQSRYSGASFVEQGGNAALDPPVPADMSFLNQGLAQDGLDLMPPGAFAFQDQFDSEGMLVAHDGAGMRQVDTGAELDPVFNPFSSTSILEEQQPSEPAEGVSFENPQPTQPGTGAAPWGPINPRNSNADPSQTMPPPISESSPIFVFEDPAFVSPSPPRQYSPSLHSASVSPPAVPSPRSPIQIKLESGVPEPSRSPVTAAPSASASSSSKAIPIRKVNSSNRVQKRKTTAPAVTSAPNISPSASIGSTTASKFLIVTPRSIDLASKQLQRQQQQQQQRSSSSSSSSSSASSTGSTTSALPNPAALFECFDALARGPSQRGRKGPLATDTKQSALQVRRMGACFSCHARKVRCDCERPCRSCVRLATQVPQVVCWQFADFTGVLFPEFVRGHLRREEVVRFVEANVESFTVAGVEVPCTVRLVSGVGFTKAVLEVKAKGFTARTPDVLQHWHVVVGRGGVDLHSRGAAPIGLEVTTASSAAEGGSSGSGGDAQKSELKRRLREYIQAIVDEPRFAELVTPPPQHTELPRRVLRIVHDYANRCDAPMVRRALSIYAMHFVMTRHLCLTQANIAELRPTGLVPQGVPWVTPRVLNRQIKAVLDEMLCREMVQLFEHFAKALKPKLRREWAPCLASFLVLCLFMESVETAADMYVMSDNEINLRHHYAPAWKRSFVLDVNAQIENMPFKQFAFQFHQIYQTHSRDAAARSFNPLVDDACFEMGELDREAADMVRQLRWFINEDCKIWSLYPRS
jgi:hypothetical protein